MILTGLGIVFLLMMLITVYCLAVVSTWDTYRREQDHKIKNMSPKNEANMLL